LVENRQSPVILDTTGKDVHAEAVRLREQGSVARVELPQGVMGWAVVGYDTATKLLTDPRVSKNPRQHWPAYINGDIRPDWPLASWPAMDNMTTAYGSDHTRLRKPVMKAFTPRRVRDMKPYIEKKVASLLDDMAAFPPDEILDLKKHFSYRLPASIICDLFGIPEESRAGMLRGGEVTTDSSITPEEAEANVRMWTGLFQQFIDAKRQTPGEDLTSDLIMAGKDDGTALSDLELIGTLFLVLGAGSETVMNLITNAVYKLIVHPEQRALLEGGQVTWDDVIEETLRAESPTNMLPLRYAVEDIEVDGVTIPKGDPILVGLGAIGRDPAMHGDTADEWDLTRADKSHLSFGYGTHNCLGAPLARLEAQIALPALFDRFPEIALGVEPDELMPQGTFIMNGFKTMPVRLRDPAQGRRSQIARPNKVRALA
jgi:2-hydroxy-5-methyl-1-naphthoate 7-hydroxylase